MGSGGAERFAGAVGQGFARQTNRHRGREPDPTVFGQARRRGSRRILLGATEVKPPKLADAIVEVTETGSSLKANNLRIVAELLQSTTRFIANEKAAADPWKRQKMDDLVLMLRGAMAAEGKVGLMMNVLKTRLPAVLKVLPNANPTVSPLADGAGVDVVVILEEQIVRRIVPQLKQAGATSIVEYALNKIID